MQADENEPGLPAEGEVQQIAYGDLKFFRQIGEGNYGDVHVGKLFDLDGTRRATACVLLQATFASGVVMDRGIVWGS